MASAALVVGAVSWVDSGSGREFVARRIESFVSGQIAGKMRIGGIDSISLDHVVAHDIRFLAPGGELVLHARHVEVDLRMLGLLQGRIATNSGRVRGGSLHLVTDAREDLGLDLAFRAPQGGTTSGSVTVDLDRITVSDMRVRVRASGVPDTRVTRLNCLAHVWTPEPGASVQVRASYLAARVTASTPIPISLVLARGTVRFDGASADRARVDARGTMGGSRMRLEATVSMGRDHPRVIAEVTVDGTMGWIRSIPLILQATVADVTSSRFDLRVRSADL